MSPLCHAVRLVLVILLLVFRIASSNSPPANGSAREPSALGDSAPSKKAEADGLASARPPGAPAGTPVGVRVRLLATARAPVAPASSAASGRRSRLRRHRSPARREPRRRLRLVRNAAILE